ncbi:thioredoxin family protein [Fodinibius salsisoli]|uniref:Thioredoxin fold domain-containing protein n=1 Tax=Fodinibius salsisoli TaxID=2820877 RepID=A0ABT3PSD2_9BACT|nr:thioredoxin fold domain-containing protein [Fodinibius salsisoli]MCW9708775.1 thioredoxin fold domain-containing protein [Fodinibius salsisoli]
MAYTNRIIVVALVTLLGITMTTSAQNSDIDIDWYEMEEAQKLARANDKKVLVFAEASWCTICKKVKREIFPNKDIRQTMSAYYYPVKIDIESDELLRFNGEEMTQEQFGRQMRVTGTPTFLFIDKEGSVIGAQPGFIPRDVYKSLMIYVGTDAHHEMEFEQYLDNNQ